MKIFLDREEIMDVLKEKKTHFHIANFVLFGSVATNTATKESDIDIAYILEDGKKMSFQHYIELEEELTQSLQHIIDLMNFKKLNPLIKFNAQKDFIYV